MKVDILQLYIASTSISLVLSNKNVKNKWRTITIDIIREILGEIAQKRIKNKSANKEVAEALLFGNSFLK